MPGLRSTQPPKGRLWWALLPALLTAGLIARFGVDLPVADQWQHLLLLEKYLTGSLTTSDLFSFHQEHRLVLPRLVWFPLARLTGWDVRFEMAISFLIACATFALLWRRQDRLGQRSLTASLVLAVLFFGWQQWENWLWGAQLQVFGVVFFVIAGLTVLTEVRSASTRYPLAFGCGVLALLCHSTAFPFFLVVLLDLLLRSTESQRQRITIAAGWIIGLLALIWLYGHQTRNLGGSDLGQQISYVSTFLGSPIAALERPPSVPDANIFPAAMTGMAGLVILLLLWLDPSTRRDLNRRFFLLLSIYSVGVAAMTMLGRASIGVSQALLSRYTTFPLLLWISVALLLISDSGADKPPRWRFLRSGIVALIVCGSVLTSAASLPVIRETSIGASRLRETLGPDGPSLGPSREDFHQGLLILDRWNLSLCRSREPCFPEAEGTRN